ncbi:MAG: hypothetical protein C6I05_06280 [Epsilonproteobacteria bacterium]|nr:hypothetical protein [Campylobacterota bacterium]
MEAVWAMDRSGGVDRSVGEERISSPEPLLPPLHLRWRWVEVPHRVVERGSLESPLRSPGDGFDEYLPHSMRKGGK